MKEYKDMISNTPEMEERDKQAAPPRHTNEGHISVGYEGQQFCAMQRPKALFCCGSPWNPKE